MRRTVRLPALILLLFGGLFTVLVLFPFGGERFRRGAIRHWSRMLIATCGVRPVAVRSGVARPLAELPAGRLVVANHISWIDIFVIHSQCPCAFVAKDEIRAWPLLGTLVARTGTLFIERGKRRAVHRMIEHIERRLQAGGRVAVFPEGTTSDGRRLLPFHANLIEGAVRAGVPVAPVGIRYVDGNGETSPIIEYIGDTTFVASLWRIIGARAVRCEVIALEEIAVREAVTRHEIAQQARAALAARLALPLDDELPENLRELRRVRA